MIWCCCGINPQFRWQGGGANRDDPAIPVNGKGIGGGNKRQRESRQAGMATGCGGNSGNKLTAKGAGVKDGEMPTGGLS